MIDSEIHGEIGQIMFDYQWNEMVRGYGLAQLTAPVYDKKLWPDNGYFEAPTLRGITSIVCDIAGTITGQSWWLGLVDDALFSVLDLGLEGKDPASVGLAFAKAAAVNTLSCGLGAAGKTVMGAASTITNTALRITAQTAWSMGSSYIANVGAGFVNALDYNNGEVTFNWDKAIESMYSANTIAGALGAGISTSLSLSVDNKLRTTANGAEINKIYGGAINLGISAASKAGEYSVYAGYALSQGRTLQDAFDDMGGISINVLSLGSIADMLANGVSRTNGTGQSKLVKLADSLRGTGILELNFGSKGISARIGTGGIDVGSNLYDLVKRQSDKNAIQNYAKTAGKDKYETVWNNYIYGDTVQENTSARIAYGKDELILQSEMTGMGKTERNISTGGRKIQIQDTGDKFGNAFELGHESYRDGVVSDINSQKEETFNAVVGHAKMAARMSGYGIFFGGDYGLEALAYMKGDMDTLREVTEEYYSSEEDTFYTKQEYIGWYQNSGKGNKGYNITPLGNAPTEERTEQINLARQKEKYNLFLTDSLNKYNEDNNTTLTMEDFEKTDSFTTLEDFKTLIDNDRKKKNDEKQYELYYHNILDYIGLNENGCALACAAYNVYSLTGQFYSLAKTNEIAKELGLFYEGSGMLNNMKDGYAKLLNKMIGDDVIEFVESYSSPKEEKKRNAEENRNNKREILERYYKSSEEFLCLLKLYNGNGSHFTNLDDLNYNEELIEEGKKLQYVDSVDVNNPWYSFNNPKPYLAADNYTIDNIDRITIFKVDSQKIKRNIPKKELYEERVKYYEKTH